MGEKNVKKYKYIYKYIYLHLYTCIKFLKKEMSFFLKLYHFIDIAH